MTDIERAQSWDWDAVRTHLLASGARNADDPRNVVVLVAVESLGSSGTRVELIDRRNGDAHHQTFDLADCVIAYDATSNDQLVGMIYADLEEALLAGRAG